MNIGGAIQNMRFGYAMRRAGWNGKGMFIYLVPENRYPAQTGVAKEHFGEEGLVPYKEYIAIKTAEGDVVPWTASQSDILAEDWEAVADLG